MKLNFGCGGNSLEGWSNHDSEVDIRKRLPFPDESADFILAEHVVEHVTPQQAWNFFKECHRILKPGGVIRIAVPDICRIARLMTNEYREAVKAGGHGDNPIRAAIFEHGHQGAWNQELLVTFLEGVGFKVERCSLGASSHPELCMVEGHGKVVGEHIASIETSVAEGIK